MAESITVTYEKKPLPAWLKTWSMILVVVGLAASAGAFAMDPQRATFASNIGYMLAMSIGLGSMFLIAIEYVAGAVWSVPIRRIAEFMTNALWIAPILGLPILLNILNHWFDMYHWTHLEDVMNDPFLKQKRPYLNEQSFLIRTGIIWAGSLIFKTLIVGNSYKQDKDPDQKYSKRNIKLSALFLAFFAISITLTAIDFMMSLEPHWYSTIFGVYYFAGSFATAVAIITLFVLSFNKNDLLIYGVNKDHYYSLGGWMFAFTAFWMYMAFSQFMLIWYANIPEETFWFMPRMEGGWAVVSALLIFIKFIIPFGMLIQRESKTNPSRLRFAAIWIIAAHIYDLYWVIYPTYSHLTDNHSPVFGWQELGPVILTLGLTLLAFRVAASKRNYVAVGDPKLERGLNFHL